MRVTSGVRLGIGASLATAIGLFTLADGWRYYRTPLAIRGYDAAHALLRPSGPLGQTMGLVGALMMLVPFLYLLRKRMARWTWAGSMKTWLEVHLFCGIVGPVLVTFHTSFKFNGIVSVAYWAMVVVVLSGFVGRYLYVRIPKTLRGTEMSRAELDRLADELRVQIAAATGSDWQAEIAAIDDVARRQSPAGLLLGDVGLRLRVGRLARSMNARGVPAAERDALVRLTLDRAVLVRRIAYLERTKAAFALWHVFHLPFVYLLLLIVSVHVGVTLYLGYVPFRW
jgi:hypothetical protein